jgi:hypothetical protein
MGEISDLPKNKYRTTLYLDSEIVLRFKGNMANLHRLLANHMVYDTL